MSMIPNFSGDQFLRGSLDYEKHRYQYGFSSFQGRVHPGLIAFPKSIDDVVSAVKYASREGLKVAVRTGGHQYSAASSTVGNNIQLDMSGHFHDFDDSRLKSDQLFGVGISFTLAELNKMLGDKGYFVPHGQCSHIHLGGHAQTGGYGQLSRAFGLFGDHIMQIKFVTAEGEDKTLDRNAGTQEERDWFYAFLGGSPGNFGILYHLTLKVHSNKDHPRARGLKIMSLYSPKSFAKLLSIKAEMASEVGLVGDLDYCITVLSNTLFSLEDNFGIDADFKRDHPQVFGTTEVSAWPACIMVFAQWANRDGASQSEQDEKIAMGWLDKIANAVDEDPLVPRVFLVHHRNTVPHKTMSELTKEWIFLNVREFDLPYNKRTYITNSITLNTNGWADWVNKRTADGINSDDFRLSIQVQHFGGSNSRFYRNLDNPENVLNAETSYSWRDSTVCITMNCFYEDGMLHKAEKWQKKNDAEIVRYFGNQDKRLLWGSYNKEGEKLDLVAQGLLYHEIQSKYDKLCQIKWRTDPLGVLVANRFCVGWNNYYNVPEEDEPSMSVAKNTDRDALKDIVHRVQYGATSGMKDLMKKHFENLAGSNDKPTTEDRPSDVVVGKRHRCCAIL